MKLLLIYTALTFLAFGFSAQSLHKHPQKISLEKTIPNEEYSIIGTWKTRLDNCSLYLEFKPDQKCDSYTNCGGFPNFIPDWEWNYTNAILYQTDPEGTKYESPIEWVDEDKMILTNEDGSKSVCKRSARTISELRSKEKNKAGKICNVCEGRKVVKCCDIVSGGIYRSDCLSPSTYTYCLSTPNPCEVVVMCCKCQATGRIKE